MAELVFGLIMVKPVKPRRFTPLHFPIAMLSE